jgi:hypothetical protein
MEEATETEKSATGKRRTVVRLLSIIAIVAVAAIPLVYQFLMDQREPNPYLMRRHVVANLSDQQIRDIHEQSRLRFEKMRAEIGADDEEFWRRKAESQKKCQADIAFRAKNPSECTLPLTWRQIGQLPPGWRSVEEVFEHDIMGMCNYAKTIREAKKWNCLPE